MATINGKPSVFLSLDPPASEQGIPVPDYQTRVAEHVQIATAMAESLVDPLDDPETQADLNAWHDAREAEFQNDPEAQRHRDEWCEEQARAAEMEAEAEAAELASLGVAGQHAIAGHDARWQNGGAA